MNDVIEKKSWLTRLKEGLSKTSSKLSTGITDIFIKKKLDDETLGELEELLITSDIGVQTAAKICKELAKNRFDKEISSDEIKTELSKIITDILTPVAISLEPNISLKPHVILVCGVNGNGKTTTIGKLAKKYTLEGKKVYIAACDTFRAAAVGQLGIWAERSGAHIIECENNADPASVAYKALDAAKNENADILLIDTAGRLHNKTNLMEELAKIVRVIKKLDGNAPHDTILVLDATTGQNAHSQIETFKKLINITGLIVTKLDGTAKAGVIVSLAEKYQIKIHAIGVGEGIEDLKSFDPSDFAKSLVGLI